MKKQARVVFSKKDIQKIESALPLPVRTDRHQKLGALLRTWGQNELAEHLSPRPSPKANEQRNQRILKVGTLAQKLQAAINALDEADRMSVTLAMTMGEVRLPPANTGKTKQWKRSMERLSEEPCFLGELAKAAPKSRFKFSRRNDAAYLVMLDAAAIFKFLTGRNPTRVVDRGTGKETGAFWHFLETLWPIIFRSGASGLRAAVEKWYDARNFGEVSALIANIGLQCRWGT